MLNRIELNTHSVFDEMDSVITIPELAEFAKRNHMLAIALTDLNCVQGFPNFERECRNAYIKPIYGAKIIHGSFKDRYPCVSTVLVKNQVGLKNLYKIISELKNDGACVSVPISVLEKYHEGLLYGSCGHEGSVFQAYQNDFDELEDFLKFYDYFEIENFHNTEKERKINDKIVKSAKELKKPVVAVSDARYVQKDDYICIEILGRKSRTNRWFNKNKNLHLRSTDEMLAEFSYLGEDTEDVVINNTHKLARQIEKITIIPNEYFKNIIRDAYSKIKMFAKSFVTNKYGDDFGEKVPEEIKNRLDSELKNWNVACFADKILLSRIIVNEIHSRDRLCNTRGAIALSFLAYCLGITTVNPLPAHYYCPKCKKIEWVEDFYCGIDLPDKKCSCGADMQGDGMNISHETFFGFSGDSVPDIDINADGETADIVINKISSEILKDCMFACAGTINTVMPLFADKLIADYEKTSNVKFDDCKKAKIADKISEVKQCDDIHPSVLFIFPKNKDILNFTPIRKEKYHGLPITHFSFYDLYHTVYKCNIVPVKYFELISTLERLTGVKAEEIPPNSKEIFTLIKDKNTEGILEFGRTILSEVLSTVNPQTFSDLIKLVGLTHGTNTWKNNAELLLKKGICKLSEIPASKDDIFYDLTSHGLYKRTAFRYAEMVRKGYFAKGRLSAEEIEKFENDLTNIGMPRWYADYCKKILYMFPKSPACEIARIAVIEAFYKANFNELYDQLYKRILRV